MCSLSVLGREREREGEREREREPSSGDGAQRSAENSYLSRSLTLIWYYAHRFEGGLALGQKVRDVSSTVPLCLCAVCARFMRVRCAHWFAAPCGHRWLPSPAVNDHVELRRGARSWTAVPSVSVGGVVGAVNPVIIHPVSVHRDVP